MTIAETKATLMASLRHLSYRAPRQSLHQEDRGASVYCEEFDLHICIGHYKSYLRNKDLALILMELAIDEAIK